MKKLFLCFFIFISAQTVVAEEIRPTKKVLIDTLLEQMGQSAVDTGKHFSDMFIEGLSSSLRAAKPDIDPRAFDIVEEVVKDVLAEAFDNKNNLAEMMYPIYGKRFSEGELSELIAFYQTPLGQKLIRELPGITKEGMVAGQKFGQSLAPEIRRRIEEKFQREGIEM